MTSKNIFNDKATGDESGLVFIYQSGKVVFYTIRNDLSGAFIDNVATTIRQKLVTLADKLVLGIRARMVMLRVLRSFP